MSGSSTRRSLSQTALSSPGTLRRLRSTVQKVQFSDSSRKRKNLNDKNESVISQQHQQSTTTNKLALQTDDDFNDQEMIPSNIINLLSLTDQETSKITKNQIIISSKSLSISDSDEENEDSVDTNGPTMNN